jgi:hypothetical protein
MEFRPLEPRLFQPCTILFDNAPFNQMRRGEEKFVSEICVYLCFADELADLSLEPRGELLRFRRASFTPEDLAPFFQQKRRSRFVFVPAPWFVKWFVLSVVGARDDLHVHFDATTNEIESRIEQVVAGIEETFQLRLRDEGAKAKRQGSSLIEEISRDSSVREYVFASDRHPVAAGELTGEDTKIAHGQQTNFGTGNAAEGVRQCVDACGQAVNV